MSTLIYLADAFMDCVSAGHPIVQCSGTTDGLPVPYETAPAPYETAPAPEGGGGEAWSFLGMGANIWLVIIAGLIIWALVAGARRRHREELARHEGLRTRYQDQAPPESNLGGGGDYYDAGYDEPRSMYGDRGRAPGPDDDWEEL